MFDMNGDRVLTREQVVALVKKTVPSLGPAELAPVSEYTRANIGKKSLFFECGRRPFLILFQGTTLVVERYGIWCARYRERPYLSPEITRYDKTQVQPMMFTDFVESVTEMLPPAKLDEVTLARITRDGYASLFDDLSEKAKRVKRALGRKVW